MYKRSKKEMAINIEEKKGHLFLGNEELRLLILRPIDLIEFAEFAKYEQDKERLPGSR